MGNARAGWMVRTMQEKVRDTVMRIVNGPKIRIPQAFMSGEGEGPAEGHSGSRDDRQKRRD
jgi:hypothetical protein